jgi:hypothetical protein
VKGRAKKDSLEYLAAGMAAEKTAWSAVTSLAHIKLRISENQGGLASEPDPSWDTRSPAAA